MQVDVDRGPAGEEPRFTVEVDLLGKVPHMWATILGILLPWLSQFIVAFVQNMEKADAANEPFMSRVSDIVTGIEAAHPTATGDDKWQLAFDAVKQLAVSEGKTIATSAVNTAIELAVQKLKANE
jgi:Bacteriophage holin of superfamily 6 (Holin_LLH)